MPCPLAPPAAEERRRHPPVMSLPCAEAAMLWWMAIGMSSFMELLSEGMNVRSSQHQACGRQRGLSDPPEGCWQQRHATRSQCQM